MSIPPDPIMATPETRAVTEPDVRAKRRKSAVIAYDYDNKVGPLPSMRINTDDGTPAEREYAILCENRLALDRYFQENPVPPCTDTHCTRCKDRIETYVLCAKCIKRVQNYYKLGIIKRTLYMAQKSGAAAEKDERAKSQMLWQMYHTVHQ